MNKALMSIFSSLWLFSASAFAQVRELPAPAGRGSGQPNLAVAPDGRVYLSWIERLGEGRFSLRFALKEGDGWSAPRVIFLRAGYSTHKRFVLGGEECAPLSSSKTVVAYCADGCSPVD